MRTRHLIACGLAALSLTAAGCGDDDDKDTTAAKSGDQAAETQPEETQADESGGAAAAPKPKPKVEVPAGPAPKKLVIEDVVKGDGATAKAGSEVTANYVGVSYSTKKEFDSSFGKQPIVFPLGAGGVIPGWDEGIQGMKVGGRRKLVIPPDMAYGKAGYPPAIKPNETLVFIVDLLDVN
jgi:peptidylprolyl isomerase